MNTRTVFQVAVMGSSLGKRRCVGSNDGLILADQGWGRQHGNDCEGLGAHDFQSRAGSPHQRRHWHRHRTEPWASRRGLVATRLAEARSPPTRPMVAGVPFRGMTAIGPSVLAASSQRRPTKLTSRTPESCSSLQAPGSRFRLDYSSPSADRIRATVQEMTGGPFPSTFSARRRPA
jgi:hypothetical protein